MRDVLDSAFRAWQRGMGTVACKLIVSPSIAVTLENTPDIGWVKSDEPDTHAYLVGSYGFRVPVVVERALNGTDSYLVAAAE